MASIASRVSCHEHPVGRVVVALVSRGQHLSGAGCSLLVEEPLLSQVVASHPLLSQVSLGLQPAVVLLVGLSCLPAQVVTVKVGRPTLRLTVVVREPSFHCYVPRRQFGRSIPQPTRMRGLLRVRLLRALGLLVQVRSFALLSRAWPLPRRDGGRVRPTRRLIVLLNCWSFVLLLPCLVKWVPAAP